MPVNFFEKLRAHNGYVLLLLRVHNLKWFSGVWSGVMTAWLHDVTRNQVMYHKLLGHITFAILENLLSPRKVMYHKLLGHITFAILQ